MVHLPLVSLLNNIQLPPDKTEADIQRRGGQQENYKENPKIYQVGILELLNDPFARTRVVSKKGKINTHRDSYHRGFKV